MDMSFAHKIRELRNKKKWSVYELAESIGRTPGYVSKIEARGEIPSPEMISKLANALKANAKELFELAKREKHQQLTQSVNRKYDHEYSLYRKGERR